MMSDNNSSIDLSAELDPTGSGYDQSGADVSDKSGTGNLEDFVRLYLLPISMFALSVGLIMLLVFPLGNSILATFTEINELRATYEDLEDRRQRRVGLQSVTNQQRQVLNRIDRLIPQSQTAVVDFSESVQQIAQRNRLQVLEAVVGEVVTVSTNPADDFALSADSNLELVELPAEFLLRGRFEDIRRFLQDLYTSGDFIIIKEMELGQVPVDTQDQLTERDRFRRIDNADNWRMSVTFVKYQFRVKGEQDTDSLRNFYFNVPDGVRSNQEVIEFIEQNYPE